MLEESEQRIELRRHEAQEAEERGLTDLAKEIRADVRRGEAALRRAREQLETSLAMAEETREQLRNIERMDQSYNRRMLPEMGYAPEPAPSEEKDRLIVSVLAVVILVLLLLLVSGR